MCTVSFIPTRHSKDYILTSNRDEAPSRAATLIKKESHSTSRWMFPQDPRSKGSWIAANNHGRCVCLLNGAFKRHHSNPPYRKSRGLVLLDSLNTGDINSFFDTYDLDKIEPFTLVVVEGNDLFEFRWDGNKRFLKALNRNESYIWASSSLYDLEQIEARKNWFASWKMEYPRPNQTEILDFHTYSGTGDKKNDLIMNRADLVRTVSISSVWCMKNKISLLHTDLESLISNEYSLKLLSNSIED